MKIAHVHLVALRVIMVFVSSARQMRLSVEFSYTLSQPAHSTCVGDAPFLTKENEVPCFVGMVGPIGNKRYSYSTDSDKRSTNVIQAIELI